MNPVDSNRLNISLKEIFFQKIKIAKTEKGLKEELKQCLSGFGKLITFNFQVFDENKNRVDTSNLTNTVNQVYWIELMIYWENGKTYQTKFTINNEFSEYEELRQIPPAKEIINLENAEDAIKPVKTRRKRSKSTNSSNDF
jgi:hypothetical protein